MAILPMMVYLMQTLVPLFFLGFLINLLNGNVAVEFENLTDNQMEGLTLELNTDLLQMILTLTNGVTSTWDNKLILDNGLDNDNDAIIGGGSASYINGPVKIIGYDSLW